MLRIIQSYRFQAIAALPLCLFMSVVTANGQSKAPQKDTALSKIDSLTPVTVRPKEIRPRLRGDTTEYNTSNIRLRVNANVEELLGRLPGLQIDADGTITYNGQVISKLLVDGEDLFGSDPRIVTRNFDASRIDKVQVLERKSDQARFTGIDDGNRTKTLNLVLKEDSKKGYFGKVEAGANANGLYNANGLVASFRQREQIAAIGLASNTGSTSFNSNNAGIYGLASIEDPLNASAGNGVPRYQALGTHYANTWNGEANHLVGNYQYGDMLTKPVTSTNTIQTLHDSVYGQYRRAASTNQQQQHNTGGQYDWAVNNVSAFQFNYFYINSKGNNQLSDSTLGVFNDTVVNRTQRSIRSMNSKEDVLGAIAWKIQSRKKSGRVFSVSTRWMRTEKNTDGYLYSLNRFYQPNGSLQTSDTVDQRKAINTYNRELYGGLTYAEPLWGKNVLGLSYNMSAVTNNALQSTYNRGNGKYLDLVDSLSSHFDNHTVSQSATINFQGTSGHWQYTVIAGMQLFSYRQYDLMHDSTLRYHYVNFSPHAVINYTPNPTSRINLEYSAFTQQPSISQLQPIVNNNDPLHITLGNPNLKTGFSQNLKFGFMRTRSWMYNLNLDLGLTSSTISVKTTIDSLGRQISQPVNVDGGGKLNLGFSINKKIAGIDAGVITGLGYNRNMNYVNADLNRNENYTGNWGLKLGKYVADKYSIQLNTLFSYFDSRSSINSAAPVHYWTENYYGNVSLFFIPGFDISTYAAYNWQQKSNSFAKNTSLVFLGASIGHNFLDNRLVMKLSGNNLLNQATGIGRSNTGNVYTETSSNVLGRYFLLSATYRFEHKYKKSLKGN